MLPLYVTVFLLLRPRLKSFFRRHGNMNLWCPAQAAEHRLWTWSSEKNTLAGLQQYVLEARVSGWCYPRREILWHKTNEGFCISGICWKRPEVIHGKLGDYKRKKTLMWMPPEIGFMIKNSIHREIQDGCCACSCTRYTLPSLFTN